jgi:methionine synthase I (cobalamin-dependent)
MKAHPRAVEVAMEAHLRPWRPEADLEIIGGCAGEFKIHFAAMES